MIVLSRQVKTQSVATKDLEKGLGAECQVPRAEKGKARNVKWNSKLVRWKCLVRLM